MRNQSDIALTAGHTHTASLQTRHQIVQKPVAQIRGVRVVGGQERVTRQGLRHALCLRFHLFTRLTFRVFTQQVVEIHRAMMQLLRVQLGGVNARDNAQGTACTSQRHHKALAAMLSRQLTQIVGRLTQAGTTHTQGENHGIAFEGLGAGQVDHAERLFTSGEERPQLRVQAQGMTHRLSHTLSVLRASRHNRQRTVRGTVGVLQYQVCHALHLNTGRIQVRVIAHFTASINVLNGQRTGGLGGGAAHRSRMQLRTVELTVQVVQNHRVHATVQHRQGAVGQYGSEHVEGAVQLLTCRFRRPKGRGGHDERRGVTRMRVAQGNHLVGAGNRWQVRCQRGRLGVQQQHRIKTHGGGNLTRQGEGARSPQRQQGTCHHRGVSQQLLEHELVAAQLALQVRCLIMLRLNTLSPHASNLRQQTRRGASHVGVVGTAETGLHIAQAVAVQQFTLVMLQQELQGRLPPGKLQFSGNNLGRNLTRVQVIEQLRQAALTQLLGQGVTLRQGHEQHAVRHEGVQARVQGIQVGAYKVGALNGVSQDNA